MAIPIGIQANRSMIPGAGFSGQMPAGGNQWRNMSNYDRMNINPMYSPRRITYEDYINGGGGTTTGGGTAPTGGGMGITTTGGPTGGGMLRGGPAGGGQGMGVGARNWWQNMLGGYFGNPGARTGGYSGAPMGIQAKQYGGQQQSGVPQLQNVGTRSEGYTDPTTGQFVYGKPPGYHQQSGGGVDQFGNRIAKQQYTPDQQMQNKYQQENSFRQKMGLQPLSYGDFTKQQNELQNYFKGSEYAMQGSQKGPMAMPTNNPANISQGPTGGGSMAGGQGTAIGNAAGGTIPPEIAPRMVDAQMNANAATPMARSQSGYSAANRALSDRERQLIDAAARKPQRTAVGYQASPTATTPQEMAMAQGIEQKMQEQQAQLGRPLTEFEKMLARGGSYGG